MCPKAGRKAGKMAKRRYGKKRGGSRSKKLPLAIALPVGMAGAQAMKYVMAGNYTSAQHVFTGIQANGGFDQGRFMMTYLPIVAGVLVHKGASRLGVNRYIPKWIPVSI